MRTILTISALLLGSACSTSPITVIERADDKPCDWCSLTETMKEKGGLTYFIGHVTGSTDSNITALFNVADLRAQAAPFKGVVDKYLDQDSYAEDLSSVSSQRVISTLRSHLPATSMQVVKRYYERVRITNASDDVRVELRVYSLVAIPTAELNSARASLVRKLQGEGPKKSLEDVMASQREPASPAKAE